MHGRARRTPDTDLCPHDVIAQHERKNCEKYIRENGQVASPPLDQKSHPTICQVCSKIGSAPATCARSASLRRSRGFFFSSGLRSTCVSLTQQHSARSLHPSVRGIENGQRTR